MGSARNTWDMTFWSGHSNLETGLPSPHPRSISSPSNSCDESTPKFYPPWVPNSSTHRPDGYTRITAGGQQTTIAIEVELSHKTDADYLRIAEHYELFRTIAKVLWLVPRKSTAYTLHEKMKNATKQRANPHNFVQFQDFQERGWNCKVLVGPDTGKTLSEFYSEIRQNSGERPPDASLAHLLLDLRKSPHVAMTYRGYELGDFPT